MFKKSVSKYAVAAVSIGFAGGLYATDIKLMCETLVKDPFYATYMTMDAVFETYPDLAAKVNTKNEDYCTNLKVSYVNYIEKHGKKGVAYNQPDQQQDIDYCVKTNNVEQLNTQMEKLNRMKNIFSQCDMVMLD